MTPSYEGYRGDCSSTYLGRKNEQVCPTQSAPFHKLTYPLAILRILLADEHLESDVDIEGLAKRTESFSGSDLKRELPLRAG